MADLSMVAGIHLVFGAYVLIVTLLVAVLFNEVIKRTVVR